jgi:hypothetical protein
LPPATAGGGAGNGYPGTRRVPRENERVGEPRNERNRTTTRKKFHYLQTATPNPRRCPLGTCGGEHLYLGRHEDHAGVERALGVVFPTTASRWGATTHARMPGNPSPAVRGPVRGGLVLVPRAIGSARSGSGSGLLVGEPRRTPFSFFFVPFVVMGTSPDAIFCWCPDACACARWTSARAARFFSKAQRCSRDKSPLVRGPHRDNGKYSRATREVMKRLHRSRAGHSTTALRAKPQAASSSKAPVLHSNPEVEIQL